MTDPAPLTCYVHPDRPTTLRCNNCERPICAACAIHTPTGYRCKECVRGQQKKFDTSEWVDYVAGFVTAAVLGGIASLLVGLVSNFGIFAWLIIAAGSSTAGMIIAEGCRLATRRHRSRALFITIMAGMLAGSIPAFVVQLFSFNLFSLIFLIVYLFISMPVVYARISGIQLFK